MHPFLVVIAAAWLVIGAALGVVMGRRGYDAYAWLILGLFLGPIAVIVALYVDQSAHRAAPVVLAAAADGAGPVDVLVGFDGSPECRAAALAAVDVLGPRLGRLTLARVIPLYPGIDIEEEARASLEREAAEFTPRRVGLEMVEGRPGRALSELASAGGYELLAVGTRGSGLSEEVLGSTAVELARETKVPVLLVGAGVTGGLR